MRDCTSDVPFKDIFDASISVSYFNEMTTFDVSALNDAVERDVSLCLDCVRQR